MVYGRAPSESRRVGAFSTEIPLDQSFSHKPGTWQAPSSIHSAEQTRPHPQGAWALRPSRATRHLCDRNTHATLLQVPPHPLSPLIKRQSFKSMIFTHSAAFWSFNCPLCFPPRQQNCSIHLSPPPPASVTGDGETAVCSPTGLLPQSQPSGVQRLSHLSQSALCHPLLVSGLSPKLSY